MDSIQTQVILLTNKIDALHHMIDQVNEQVTALIATQACAITPDEPGLGQMPYGIAQRPKPGMLDTVCEHKDILLDSSYLDLDRQNTETAFSQDVQIQRLTAQLTAAYNRIAALEEQLLASRVH
jgi:histidinol phosphatase-like enzyme